MYLYINAMLYIKTSNIVCMVTSFQKKFSSVMLSQTESHIDLVCEREVPACEGGANEEHV